MDSFKLVILCSLSIGTWELPVQKKSVFPTPLKNLKELVSTLEPASFTILYCMDSNYLSYLPQKVDIPVALWTQQTSKSYHGTYEALLHPFRTKSSAVVYILPPKVNDNRFILVPKYTAQILFIWLQPIEAARLRFWISTQKTTGVHFLEFSQPTGQIQNVYFTIRTYKYATSPVGSVKEKCLQLESIWECLQRLAARLRAYQSKYRTQLLTSFLSLQNVSFHLHRRFQNEQQNSATVVMNKSWSFEENIFYELHRPDFSLVPTINETVLVQWVSNVLSPESEFFFLVTSFPYLAEHALDKLAQEGTPYNYHAVVVDTRSFNFLTCSQLSPRISFAIYLYAFDPSAWGLILGSLLSITACVSLFVFRSLPYEWIHFRSIVGSNFLWALGPLLNVSTELQRPASKVSLALAICIPLWLLLGFVLNSYYQNIVISHVISPLKLESPWQTAGVEDLRGLELYTPLVVTALNEHNFPHCISRDYFHRIDFSESGLYHGVEWNDPQRQRPGSPVIVVVSKDSVLGRTPFDPEAIFGWACSEWGSIMFPVRNFFDLDRNCASFQFNSSDGVPPHCFRKAETLRQLTTFDWSNCTRFLNQLTTGCGLGNNRVAYVDNSETVELVWSELQKRVRRDSFLKGDPEAKSSQLYRIPRAWAFTQYTDEPNLYARRLQKLLESGVYRYLKRWGTAVEEQKIGAIRDHAGLNAFEKKRTRQGLDSNLVSVFYIYLVAIGICLSAILLELWTIGCVSLNLKSQSVLIVRNSPRPNCNSSNGVSKVWKPSFIVKDKQPKPDGNALLIFSSRVSHANHIVYLCHPVLWL